MTIAAPVMGYLSAGEAELNQSFLDDGYVVIPAGDTGRLELLRHAVVDLAADHLDLAAPSDHGRFLNEIHSHVAPSALNAFKLAVIKGINDAEWSRRAYFEIARDGLETLVGNELAMQRRLNLSVQLPGDDSALLAVHADVWAGDSPFEVVAWLPLVDCFASKSMFLLPPEAARQYESDFARFKDKSTDDLYRAIEDDLVWLDVPYGSVLLFNQNLMHGNVVNREGASRWSMNCRFKGLFSPYAGKRLGEFFEPITLRAASRFGMSYRLPEGLDA